jgi:opacity protein-like surface antigen
MRNFGLAIGATFAIGLAGSAIAADMPLKAPVYQAAPPVYNWSGCYIGANAGGAWSHQSVGSSVPLISDQSPASASLDSSGGIGGPHAGCNWQFTPSWVLGIEGDWSFTDLNGTGSSPNLLRSGVPAGIHLGVTPSGWRVPGDAWAGSPCRTSCSTGRAAWPGTAPTIPVPIYSSVDVPTAGSRHSPVPKPAGLRASEANGPLGTITGSFALNICITRSTA